MHGHLVSSSNAGYYAASESSSEIAAGLSDISALQELRGVLAYENRSCCTTGDLGTLDELAALTSGSANFFVSVLDADPFVPRTQSQEKHIFVDVILQPCVDLQCNLIWARGKKAYSSIAGKRRGQYLVESVVAGSQCDCSGVQAGWALKRINGSNLGKTPAELVSFLQKAASGIVPFTLSFLTNCPWGKAALLSVIKPDPLPSFCIQNMFLVSIPRAEEEMLEALKQAIPHGPISKAGAHPTLPHPGVF